MAENNQEANNNNANNPNNTADNKDINSDKKDVNTDNKTLLEAIKDTIKDVFTSHKADSKSNEDKDKEENINIEKLADADIKSLLQAKEEQWSKEKKELKEELNELKKAQKVAKAEADANRIKEAILKAKEVGFIPTDDSQREDWLIKILNADYEGTLKQIELLEQSKNPINKSTMSAEAQKTLAMQLAKQTMREHFY